MLLRWSKVNNALNDVIILSTDAGGTDGRLNVILYSVRCYNMHCIGQADNRQTLTSRNPWNGMRIRGYFQRYALYKSTVYLLLHVRTAPVRSQHVAPRGTHLAAVVGGWCSCSRCCFRRRWRLRCWRHVTEACTDSIHSLPWLRPRPCCCCCRDSVWAPTEWLTAHRNCRRM